MTDFFDRAAELELRQREDALARQRQKTAAKRAGLEPAPTVEDCGDCGDAIPIKRRKAVPGCTRCIACEQIAEAQRKRDNR